MKPELTASRLREVLDYNAETGVFTWRESRGNIRKGQVANSKNGCGYIQIGIDHKRGLMAHRLAWLYVHWRWPSEQIDHINGIRDDNRISNLRECSHAENQQNQRKPQSKNKSGFLGVSMHKQSRRWQAHIRGKGRVKHLGLFDTPEGAHAAYLKAKAELHPFQTIAEVKA